MLDRRVRTGKVYTALELIVFTAYTAYLVMAIVEVFRNRRECLHREGVSQC